MHDVMAGYVERGEVPGLVTVVSRRGEVHVDLIGTQACSESAPMQRDSIFRIASLAKPIIAVATMILLEECKLRLDEPVNGLLPRLAERRVLEPVLECTAATLRGKKSKIGEVLCEVRR